MNAVEGPILHAHSWLDKHWLDHVVGISELEVYAYGQDTGPEESGIYFLMNDRTQYLYCGLSNNISWRLDQHKAAAQIPFSLYCWIPVRQELLEDVERAYIDALRFPHNAYRDHGWWGGHGRMVEEIRKRWGL